MPPGTIPRGKTGTHNRTKTMNTTIEQETQLNGVNVTRLNQTIEAVKQDPSFAAFKFRARNRWHDGSYNVATVDSFHGTCREMMHKNAFKLPNDEPPVLLGEDKAPNPVEYVLAGLSGCMTTTLANPVRIVVDVVKV